METIIKKINDALKVSSDRVVSAKEEKKNNEMLKRSDAQDRITISPEARRRLNSGEGLFSSDDKEE